MLAVVVLACGGQPGGEPAGSGTAERVVRTVEDGVEIVTSLAPAWDDGGWTVGPEPLLEIGARSESDPPHLFFARIPGAIRLSDGTIVVGDGATNEVRYFDEAGELVRAVGGEGQGPGEFEYIREVRQCRPGKVYAFDIDWGLNLLDSAGEIEDTVELAASRGSIYELACGPGGAFLAILWGEYGEHEPGDYHRTVTRVQLMDGEGEVLQELGEHPNSGRLRYESGEGPHPFGPQTSLALTARHAIIATADAHEVELYARDGRLERIVRWPGEDLTLEPARIERLEEHQLEGLTPARAEQMRQVHATMKSPASVPAYEHVRLDAAGNLWVAPFFAPGETPGPWKVLAPDGTFLGEVAMPERFTVTEIGDDHVLGVHRDELDEERVRLYRLHKPS